MYISTETENTEENQFRLFYKSAEFHAFNSEENRRIHGIFSKETEERKMREEEDLSSARARCIPIDRGPWKIVTAIDDDEGRQERSRRW